jgi:hypothetical protein
MICKNGSMRFFLPAFLFVVLFGFGIRPLKRKAVRGAAHISARKKEKRIEWEEARSLVWNDFSGKADGESPYDCWTWSGINYTYSRKEAEGLVRIDLDAYAFFDPHRSWVKKGERTTKLLAHEQLHFDMSELYCRYFERAVRNFTFTENADTEMDSIFTVHLNELLAAQIRYDEESEHHQSQAGQAKWEQFVADELKRAQ